MVAVLDEVDGAGEVAPPVHVGNNELIGVSLMVMSALYLSYAEGNREVREIRKHWIVSSDPRESELWQSCARHSKALAKIAIRYLGEPSRILVDAAVLRAEKQEAVSLDEAKGDPRFKTRLELITSLPMRTVRVWPDWVVAIERGSLTVKDVLDTVRSLEGKAILLKYLSSCGGTEPDS